METRMRRHHVIGAILGVVALGGAWLAQIGTASGQPVTATSTDPGTDTFTVPAGICQVSVETLGAEGGSAAPIEDTSQQLTDAAQNRAADAQEPSEAQRAAAEAFADEV